MNSTGIRFHLLKSRWKRIPVEIHSKVKPCCVIITQTKFFEEMFMLKLGLNIFNSVPIEAIKQIRLFKNVGFDAFFLEYEPKKNWGISKSCR